MPSPLTLPVRYTTHKPPVGAPIRAGHPLARGLDVALLMNEGAGGVLHDASGNHQRATLNGAVAWDRGMLKFPGVTSANATGTAPAFATGTFSVIVGHIPSDLSTIRALLAGGLVGSAGNAFALDYRSTTTLYYDLYGAEYEVISPAVTLGATHQTALTVAGTAVSLYQDGALLGTETSTRSYTGGSFLLVGAYEESPSLYWPWDGWIDFVYVYRRILTPGEVRALYLAPYQVFD